MLFGVAYAGTFKGSTGIHHTDMATVGIDDLHDDLKGIAGAYEESPVKILCSMQNSETWTGASCTVSADYDEADIRMGDHSIKIVTAGGSVGTATCALPFTHAAVRAPVGVWVKVEDLSDITLLCIELHDPDDGAADSSVRVRPRWKGVDASDSKDGCDAREAPRESAG